MLNPPERRAMNFPSALYYMFHWNPSRQLLYQLSQMWKLRFLKSLSKVEVQSQENHLIHPQVLTVDDQSGDVELHYLVPTRSGRCTYRWQDIAWQTVSDIITKLTQPAHMPGRGIILKFDEAEISACGCKWEFERIDLCIYGVEFRKYDKTYILVQYLTPTVSNTSHPLCPIPHTHCVQYPTPTVSNTPHPLCPIPHTHCVQYPTPTVSNTPHPLCPIPHTHCVQYHLFKCIVTFIRL